ncbi:MAG: DUF4268 domain-containing protein [Candidatus Poribacteria bacterium]|nr:DUF4268 domain-containing protein [Candidatus Poribacteria bacterium]
MSKELSRLEEVELREIWPDEAQNFTPWLAEEENLDLLAQTLNMELELEAQEIYVGDFRADILCRNIENPEHETWVLIENQLGETNHRHLGQILTYSAGLDAHTIIWIAKKFREEHRAALDHLNEITDERFRYFGAEIKVWQIGDSARAPQFEIVSSPNDWRREISQEARRAETENFSPAQLQRKKFWAQFRDYISQRGSQLQPRERKSTRHLIFDIGRQRFAMSAWRKQRDGLCCIELYMTGKNASAHFYLLKEEREKIESEFGESLIWQEKIPNVVVSQGFNNLTDETDWPNQHKWLADNLEKLDKVFRPRVKALNATDWEPPEDEDDE